MSKLLTMSYWVGPAVDSEGDFRKLLLIISASFVVIGLIIALFPLKRILKDRKPLIGFLKRVGKQLLTFGTLLLVLFVLREQSLGVFSARLFFGVFGISFIVVLVADIRYFMVKLPIKMQSHEEVHKKRTYLPQKRKKRAK